MFNLHSKISNSNKTKAIPNFLIKKNNSTTTEIEKIITEITTTEISTKEISITEITTIPSLTSKKIILKEIIIKIITMKKKKIINP